MVTIGSCLTILAAISSLVPLWKEFKNKLKLGNFLDWFPRLFQSTGHEEHEMTPLLQ